MQIAWIYPINRRCGISIYSEKYLHYLSKLVDVHTFSSDDVLIDPIGIAEKLNQYDIIHIQYETSFFMKSRKDIYTIFINKIKKPIIISLHEVYEEFPGVYPKSSISGLFSPVKKLIYDFKHPLVSTYEKHLRYSFTCSKLLVHYNFQKEIIEKKVALNSEIEVVPHPSEINNKIEIKTKNKKTLSLISMGFINRNYNYKHLFATLEKLTIPWTFSWLGGPRTSEDSNILSQLKHEIVKRDWNNKITFTGWLSDNELLKHIQNSDIILHLYKNRSSSGTLCKSLSFGIPVIATKLPLTIELQKDTGIVLTTEEDKKECSELIEDLYNNDEKRTVISKKEYAYAQNHSYSKMSSKLLDIYRKLNS